MYFVGSISSSAQVDAGFLALKLNTGFPGGKPQGGTDSDSQKKFIIIGIDTAVPVRKIVEYQTPCIDNSMVDVAVQI